MRKILWAFCEFPRITSTPVDPSPKFPHGGQIMRTNRFAIFTTALLFVALALSVGAGAADQHSGTWKMNPAKSKYSPGPIPKSTTVKIESDADNIKLSSDGIDAAGNPTHVAYTAKDAGTIRSTIKKGDQVVMTVTSVISKDGTTRTSTFKGKDAKGQDINNVVVYDKQ